jgi:predicted GNAT family N-acyltransferase
MSDTAEIVVCVTEDFAPCRALRIAVFVQEQGYPLDEEFDDLDADAVHLLARRAGVPVGTARMIRVGDTVKIGRICVARSGRGTGLGAALVRAGLAHFEHVEGVSRAYLSAQTHARGFYEKLGFSAYGDEYMDGAVPHIDMERALAAPAAPGHG